MSSPSPSPHAPSFPPGLLLLNLPHSTFARFTPSEQVRTTDRLAWVLQKARAGDPDDLEFVVGVPPPRKGEAWDEAKVDKFVDGLYWQMVQLLRYSTPSRIALALPYITAVLAHNAKYSPALHDHVPLIYRGVALSLSADAGEQKRAVRELRRTLGGMNAGEVGVFSSLWGRAALSRVLRRLGRVKEAKKEELWLINWIKGHPYAMTPSKFIEAVSEEGTPNYILDHPAMANFGENVMEFPGGGGMFAGGMMMMQF